MIIKHFFCSHDRIFMALSFSSSCQLSLHSFFLSFSTFYKAFFYPLFFLYNFYWFSISCQDVVFTCTWCVLIIHPQTTLPCFLLYSVLIRWKNVSLLLLHKTERKWVKEGERKKIKCFLSFFANFVDLRLPLRLTFFLLFFANFLFQWRRCFITLYKKVVTYIFYGYFT